MKNVAVLVGSNRKEAFSKKLSKAFIKIAPNDLLMKIVGIEDLPLFCQDLEQTPPKEWTDFRNEIAAADAVLIFTPEYNRSYTPLIKNALDIGSRPYSKGVLQGKTAAIVSSSPGSLGGVSANLHLHAVCNCIGMITLGQPEMYMGLVHQMLTDDLDFKDELTKIFVEKFLNKFSNWIDANSRK